MKKTIIAMTLAISSLSAYADGAQTCANLVNANRKTLARISSNSNEKEGIDLLSTLADNEHAELLAKIDNKEIDQNEAYKRLGYEQLIRQCAMFYGATPSEEILNN